MPDVGAMLAFVAKPWLIAAIVAGRVAPSAASSTRRSAGRSARVERCDERSRGAARAGRARRRRARRRHCPAPGRARRRARAESPTPVTAVYIAAGPGTRLRGERRGHPGACRRPAASSPIWLSLGGADVFLIFIESYGAVSWDRPAFASALADEPGATRGRYPRHRSPRWCPRASSRRRSAASRGWRTSACCRAPRCGIQDTNVPADGAAARHDGDRRSRVRAIARSRMMPGLQRAWPEGRSTGSTRSTDRPSSATTGRRSAGGTSPISSRSRVWMRSCRAEGSHRPLFVFFPTISTHTPFTPTPPYQPDWMTGSDADALRRPGIWTGHGPSRPTGSISGPGYVQALEYMHATIGGYLRLHARTRHRDDPDRRSSAARRGQR